MSGSSNNGGWSSEGGSPDDLPDLPEEWGVIVIPDDLSELSDEVEAIRAELRLTERPPRGQRLPPPPDGRHCPKLIPDTTAAVRPEIAVLVVTGSSASATGAVTPPTGATPQ